MWGSATFCGLMRDDFLGLRSQFDPRQPHHQRRNRKFRAQMSENFERCPIVKKQFFSEKSNRQGILVQTDSTPPSKLVFDLHVIKPFEGRNVAATSLNVSGNSTNVSWSLDDKQNLMLKTVALFINLDNTIGKDFEVGLARLKAIAEK